MTRDRMILASLCDLPERRLLSQSIFDVIDDPALDLILRC